MYLDRESNVRSYCRKFPAHFDKALGSYLYDVQGNAYLDFLAGAGALNYGHNEPRMKQAVISYLERDGVLHSLDLVTEAKSKFIRAFLEHILLPRKLDYKLQFTGPTGANTVEAALKLARKFTKRTRVVAFTNAFHGMSLGALSVSAKESVEGQVQGMEVTRFPYDGFSSTGLELLEELITQPGGIAKPAAFIVETLQCEGGLNIARSEWLKQLEDIARRNGVLLIVDEIQVGCGRTGSFFSFERAGIVPDIVCLSKSIGGLGLPMGMILLRPQLDIWEPAEHNGTFRGNNLAFVAAAECLYHYWADNSFSRKIQEKAQLLTDGLNWLQEQHSEAVVEVRGLGLVQGLKLKDPEFASRLRQAAYERKLIVESCGPIDDVIKLMPPLTVTEQEITKAISILADAFNSLSTAKKAQAESAISI